MRQVAIIDVETTGLASHDEPIEIGIVAFAVNDKGEIVGDVDAYVGRREPSVPITSAARAAHGISDAELHGRKFDDATVIRLVDWADVLVAHNAEFDARMLHRLYPGIHLKEWRCTYRQWVFGNSDRHRLTDVATLYGLDHKAHSAMGDCELLFSALMLRSGKTERSKTNIGKLLARSPFLIHERASWHRDFARAEEETKPVGTTESQQPENTSHQTKQPGAAQWVALALSLIFVAWALSKCG